MGSGEEKKGKEGKRVEGRGGWQALSLSKKLENQNPVLNPPDS